MANGKDPWKDFNLWYDESPGLPSLQDDHFMQEELQRNADTEKSYKLPASTATETDVPPSIQDYQNDKHPTKITQKRLLAEAPSQTDFQPPKKLFFVELQRNADTEPFLQPGFSKTLDTPTLSQEQSTTPQDTQSSKPPAGVPSINGHTTAALAKTTPVALAAPKINYAPVAMAPGKTAHVATVPENNAPLHSTVKPEEQLWGTADRSYMPLQGQSNPSALIPTTVLHLTPDKENKEAAVPLNEQSVSSTSGSIAAPVATGMPPQSHAAPNDGYNRQVTFYNTSHYTVPSGTQNATGELPGPPREVTDDVEKPQESWSHGSRECSIGNFPTATQTAEAIAGGSLPGLEAAGANQPQTVRTDSPTESQAKVSSGAIASEALLHQLHHGNDVVRVVDHKLKVVQVCDGGKKKALLEHWGKELRAKKAPSWGSFTQGISKSIDMEEGYFLTTSRKKETCEVPKHYPKHRVFRFGDKVAQERLKK